MEFLQNIFFKLPIIASFLGGILTFITPCILPLIPLYMSYISGTSLHNLSNYSRKQTLYNAALFVLGFSLIFFIFGLTIVGVTSLFDNKIIHYISGIIIIFFGLHFLGIFKVEFLYKTKNLNLQKLESYKFLRYIAPFIFGVSFAAGWTPCSGPIITSIGLLAATNSNLATFAILAFVVGLAMPFLLLAIFLEKGLSIVSRLKKQMYYIECISGIFLILIGVLILLDEVYFFVGLFE